MSDRDKVVQLRTLEKMRKRLKDKKAITVEGEEELDKVKKQLVDDLVEEE